jgi:hypothetical protein
LFRVAVRACRSRQLTDAFNFPPTNHLAWGGFQSNTLRQGWNHSSSAARSAQNLSRSFSARR